MPTFQVESNGQTFEIEAPDEATALSAVHVPVPSAAQLRGEGPSTPTPQTPAPKGPQDQSWLRYPRMGLQAINAGLATVPNAAITGMNLLNRATNPLVSGISTALGGPPIPYHEVPQINPMTADVQPEPGTWEPYAAGALSGASAVLGQGALARGVYAGAKAGLPLAENIIPELARMGREAFTYGAVPGAAATGAEELTKGQSPQARELAGIGTGTVAAILSHKALGAGNEFESIARRLGPTSTGTPAGDVPIVAGRAAQEAIRDWKTGNPTYDPTTGQVTYSPGSMPATIEALKAPMMAKAGGVAQTDYGNTIQALQQLTSKGGFSQPFLNAISPMLPQSLLRAFGQMAAGGRGIHAIAPSGQTTLLGVTTPVEEALTARSDFGKLISNPRLIPGGIEPTQIDTIYRALSQDIGKAMHSVGAGDEWENYNAQTSRMYKAAENTFSKVVGSDKSANETVRPEDAANYLWNHGKKGASDLSLLREFVPSAADEISAGFLRHQPEKWATLPESSKAALVPSPWDRAALDASTPHPASPFAKLQHAVEPGASAVVGEYAGKAANSALNALHSNIFIDPEVAAIVAAGGPAAIRFAHETLMNPRQLRVPVYGALAGASTNPLVIEEEKRQKGQ